MCWEHTLSWTTFCLSKFNMAAHFRSQLNDATSCPRLALRAVCIELLPCIVGHHVDCRQLHRVVAHPPVDLPAQCGQASAALAFSCLLFAPLQVRPCVTVVVTVIVIVTVLVSVTLTVTVTVKMLGHTPPLRPFSCLPPLQLHFVFIWSRLIFFAKEK